MFVKLMGAFSIQILKKTFYSNVCKYICKMYKQHCKLIFDSCSVKMFLEKEQQTVSLLCHPCTLIYVNYITSHKMNCICIPWKAPVVGLAIRII